MWYVVQTQSDNEQLVMELFKKLANPDIYKTLFIPMFEDVRKRNGVAHINLRRLFPGYFFVDTEEPNEVIDILRGIPEFTRMLGVREKDGSKVFLPVNAEDEAFLNSLMENGVMRVSLVKRGKNGRIEKIIGPLSKYSNRIIKFDISRRRAIVRADIFGKVRKLKFGLWTENDAELPWIKELVEKTDAFGSETLLAGVSDIGIYPGDRVIDETGVYENEIFTVSSVDAGRRIVTTELEIFGTIIKLRLNADEVRKI